MDPDPAATGSRPETTPPKSYPPQEESDACDDSARETCGTNRYPDAGNKRIPAEPECDQAGAGDACAEDDDGVDQVAAGRSMLDKCIDRGRLLQEAASLQDANIQAGHEVVKMGRMARKAIELCQADLASVVAGAGPCLTAESEWPCNLCGERTARLDKTRRAHVDMLEKIKRVLAIIVDMGSTQACQA